MNSGTISLKVRFVPQINVGLTGMNIGVGEINSTSIFGNDNINFNPKSHCQNRGQE